MNSNNKAFIRKMGILIAILIAMLALCGCRTRITNNDEASNVYVDEEGMLQDEYQMRRDELSLPKAKEPIFKGFGGPAEDDEEFEYGDDAEALEDYDPEEYEEEPYEEAEEVTGTTPANGTTTGTGGREVKGRKVRNGTSRSSSQEYEVTLNANGGKCDAESIKVKIGGKFRHPPSPTRDGYEFSGWNTKKDGSGTTVKSTTKVTKSAKHTLYAQWKEASEPAPEPAKTYTITFDANGEGAEYTSGGEPITVEEKGTYGTLPVLTRKEFLFDGWFTEKEGGDRVQSGDPFSANADQTLYAHWSDDPDYYYNFWNEDLGNTVKNLKDDDMYKVYSENGDKFLEGCGLKMTSKEECDYIVVFGSKSDAEGIENPDGKTIRVIPKKAIDKDTKDGKVLLYKLKVFDTFYGLYGDDVKKAAEDLGYDEPEDIEEVTPDN